LGVRAQGGGVRARPGVECRGLPRVLPRHAALGQSHLGVERSLLLGEPTYGSPIVPTTSERVG
jgi:hypothetical protein